MKNKQYELRRKQAKRYLKKHPVVNNYEDIHLYHYYGPGYKKTKAWWDDFSFKFGQHKVVVWYVHPRMEYANLVESQARKEVPYPGDTSRLDLTGPKHYRKLGASRKKLVSTEMNFSEALSNWSKEVRTRETELILTSDHIVTPYFRTKMYNYCLGVELCVPIEAVDEKSLKVVADLTRKLLRRETTLEKEFQGYSYTNRDWKIENVPKDNIGHTLGES